MPNEFQRGTESLPFAALRTVAEVGAETGFFLSPTGPLRFFLRGKPDAPPLLILHGMGDTGPGWGPVIPRLARHFRVHALDLPGHGLSVAPPDWRFETMLSAVRAYAKSLPNPVVVGHSLGGWLGARLALEGTVPLRALVLVNPAGAALSREAWEEFRTRVDAQDVRAARLYLKLAFHVPPPLLWLFPKEVLKVMQAPAARGLLTSLEERDFLTAQELSRIQVPTQLVWGQSDRFLPAGSRDFFARHVPRIQVTDLARTGHCPHLESPLVTGREIMKALRSV